MAIELDPQAQRDPIELVNFLVVIGVTDIFCVPCNHAQPIINAIISIIPTRYHSCASEAIAYSFAYGTRLAGGFPIVICQSSGYPNLLNGLASLGHAYNVYFPIITSWRSYEEGSAEIQHKFLSKALPKIIEASGCEMKELNSDLDVLKKDLFVACHTPTTFILRKGAFRDIQGIPVLWEQCPTRTEYLKKLSAISPENSGFCYVATTGHTGREAFGNLSPLFMMVGNMGGGVSLSRGLLKKYEKVVFLGGDGEFTMHMGGLTTTSRGDTSKNLLYILFDNRQNKSTGGQGTYQEHLDYINIAKASGWNVYPSIIESVEIFTSAIANLQSVPGYNFMHVRCMPDAEVGRPSKMDLLHSAGEIYDDAVSYEGFIQ